MDLKLTDKTVLITGAGSGIGREMAQQFAKENANVVIVGRHMDALEETANGYDSIYAMTADITKTEEIKKVLDEIKSRYGHLDVLINNAGWSPIHPFEEETMEEFDRCFEINVRAVAELVLLALQMLKESKGNIINIGSAAVNNHLINMSVYSAAKGAIDTFTPIWAKEFAKYGIRVNSILPGPIESPIYYKLGISGAEKEAHMSRVTAGVPLGRFGYVREVAPMALFLASEATASYITGSDFSVDGGYGI